MEAVVLTQNGDAKSSLEIKDMPTPNTGEGEIKIRVEAFGLNYADVMARKGLYPEAPPLPCILGYEVVGQIIEVDEKADTGLKIGDRVMSFTRFGGYGREVCVPALAAIKVNEKDDAGELLCLCTQYATAWYAAEEMNRIREGDVVMVHAGAGGVGTALIQIARNRKAYVIGTASTKEKIDYMKENGADLAINYKTSDFYEVLKEKELRLDVAFDPVGGANFRKTMKRLNYGGRIVTFGVSSREKKSLIPSLKVMFKFGFYHPVKLLAKSQSIMGLNMLKIGDFKPQYLTDTLHKVYKGFRAKELRPFVGHTFNVKEIHKAHTALEQRQTMGKVVIHWD